MKHYRRQYYAKPENKQRNRAKASAWRANNYERALAASQRRSQSINTRFRLGIRVAAKRNKEWLLTIEEYSAKIKEPCYYCRNKLGQPIVVGCGLDRLDNSKGYTLDNVVSCCSFCNTCKMDALSETEMLAVAQLLIKMRVLTQQ
jgi:hypothetical protein